MCQGSLEVMPQSQTHGRYINSLRGHERYSLIAPRSRSKYKQRILPYKRTYSRRHNWCRTNSRFHMRSHSHLYTRVNNPNSHCTRYTRHRLWLSRVSPCRDPGKQRPLPRALSSKSSQRNHVAIARRRLRLAWHCCLSDPS